MIASLDELKIDRNGKNGRGVLPKRAVAVAICAAGAAIIVAAVLRNAERAAETTPAEPAGATAVDAGTTGTTDQVQPPTEPRAILNASGYVTARRRATVSSKITAKVIEVTVEEGMIVRAGQVLARLDDARAQADLALGEARVAAARAGLIELELQKEEARRNRDRQLELARDNLVSEADVDAAVHETEALQARIDATRAEIVVAEREVDIFRTNLDDTVIRAPFGGVAISKNAQPGEMISPVSAGGGFTRTGISTIVDMDSLEIEVDVAEAYIHRVRSGQRVGAVLDAYPDWTIPAHVITTVPAADRQRATVLVRIGFDKPGDPRILPDMGVDVAFHDDPAPE